VKIGWEVFFYGTSKRVLNLLKTIYLRVWKIVVERVTIIKFRVNNRCGNGTGSFKFEVGADTAKFTNMNMLHENRNYG